MWEEERNDAASTKVPDALVVGSGVVAGSPHTVGVQLYRGSSSWNRTRLTISSKVSTNTSIPILSAQNTPVTPSAVPMQTNYPSRPFLHRTCIPLK